MTKSEIIVNNNRNIRDDNVGIQGVMRAEGSIYFRKWDWGWSLNNVQIWAYRLQPWAHMQVPDAKVPPAKMLRDCSEVSSGIYVF